MVSHFFALPQALLKQETPSEDQITRDINRTFPRHILFQDQGGLGQQVLFNVLKVRPAALFVWLSLYRLIFIYSCSCAYSLTALSRPQAYAVYNPNVGYCQGMGFITGLLLMYMEEEDVRNPPTLLQSLLSRVVGRLVVVVVVVCVRAASASDFCCDA